MALAVLRTPGEWYKRYTAAGKFSALSIGCFDGLHLGHQEVLRRVVARSPPPAPPSKRGEIVLTSP